MHWKLCRIPLYPFYLGVDGWTRKSKTSKRCLNSSILSDPDDLAVHWEQSMKLWRVLCHSLEWELMARGSIWLNSSYCLILANGSNSDTRQFAGMELIVSVFGLLSRPCQRLKLRYKTSRPLEYRT